MQPEIIYPDLSGKTAIVTGAGQGIGAAIARALAAAGARVAVNDINPDRAARIAGQIRAAGGVALDVMGDVSNKFQCVNIIETTRAEWGRLDILINNAGIEPAATVLKMDEWEWSRVIDVNLKGVFFMSQLVGRVMAAENSTSAINSGAENGTGAVDSADAVSAVRGGVIVNIGGRADGRLGRAAYVAAKAAVVAFARECAREFAPYGIRVNTIVPGVIDTPLNERLLEDAAALQATRETIAMRRLGSADEVAAAALFLCSAAAGYMTGSVLTIDGGKFIAGE